MFWQSKKARVAGIEQTKGGEGGNEMGVVERSQTMQNFGDRNKDLHRSEMGNH